MARIVRRRKKNPEEELPTGQWIPSHAVRFNDDGTVSLMREGGGPVANPGAEDIHRQNRLIELLNEYNGATDPAAYLSDEEHAANRIRARAALAELRRNYIEGRDYKEYSNGMLWPITPNTSVQFGHWAGGVFHPWRGSSNYKPKAAGEKGAKYKTARGRSGRDRSDYEPFNEYMNEE